MTPQGLHQDGTMPVQRDGEQADTGAQSNPFPQQRRFLPRIWLHATIPKKSHRVMT